jgi:alpha-beta hydrolase superfamily lysophospholipase
LELSAFQILLLVGGGLFLLLAALAPLETLRWWAGWIGHSGPEPLPPPPEEALLSPANMGIDQYVVYLAGIDDISDEYLNDIERQFLAELGDRLPNVRIIADVFPYSPANQALTGQRAFSWLWRRLARSREAHGKSLVGFLINLRNMFQVIVVSDNRYAPFYGLGTAQLIRDGLVRHGYTVNSGVPVTLIGYSGGGSIALNAVPRLKKIINAPVQVISLAGVLSSDPGLEQVKHLFHLYGSRDSVQAMARFTFPGRSPLQPHSEWNQARAAGKISLVCIGDMKHTSPGGYFDTRQTDESGRSHYQILLDNFVQILQSGSFDQPDRSMIYFWRTITGALAAHPNPADSYEEARARLVEIQTRDRAAGINPACESRLFDHGQKKADVLVMLHGFTACPAQYTGLGTLFFEQGYNVLVGRVPRHGLTDRLTRDLQYLTAEELVDFTDSMVDIARGLGERVTVIGLSMGGVMAAWAAQYRADVAHSMIVAPSFEFRVIPGWLSRPLLGLLLNIPDRFVWWNPAEKEDGVPHYSYPGYSTRGLGEVMRLGFHVRDMALQHQPRAGHITMITNAADMAISNKTARKLMTLWRQRGYQALTSYEFPARLMLTHALLDDNVIPGQVDEVFSTVRDLARPFS